MPPRQLTIAALAALALAGCGGDDGGDIPKRPSERLRNSLAEVKSALQRDDCDAAARRLSTVDARVEDLPDDVDDDVRQTIEDGVDELRGMVEAECVGRPEPEPEPEPEEPPPDDDGGQEPPDDDGNGNGGGGPGNDGGTGPPGQQKKDKGK